MDYKYRVIRRNKNIVLFNELDKAGNYVRRHMLDLTGYDFTHIRKGVMLQFKGTVSAGNLYYSGDILPTKLKRVGDLPKKKPDVAPNFIVLKREGSVIYYKLLTKTETSVKRRFEDETAPICTMDLNGFAYRRIYKRATFFFEGKQAPENIRFYVHGDFEPRTLERRTY